MKIIKIKDMIRKDIPIYYRKNYTGVVEIEFREKPNEYRIDFSIEIKPTGHKEIYVSFLDSLDYPLVEINNMLKQFIDELDNVGGLPD